MAERSRGQSMMSNGRYFDRNYYHGAHRIIQSVFSEAFLVGMDINVTIIILFADHR